MLSFLFPPTLSNHHEINVPAPIPGVCHSGGPPFRGSGLGWGLTLADLRNGRLPEWRTGIEIKVVQGQVLLHLFTNLRSTSASLVKAHQHTGVWNYLWRATVALASVSLNFQNWIKVDLTLLQHFWRFLPTSDTVGSVIGVWSIKDVSINQPEWYGIL